MYGNFETHFSKHRDLSDEWKWPSFYYFRVVLFVCFVARHNASLFIRNEMRYISLLTFIRFQVMFQLFFFLFSLLRFSLFLHSMTFEKYVKFWHIPTNPLQCICISIYYDGWRSYANRHKCICAGKVLCACVRFSHSHILSSKWTDCVCVNWNCLSDFLCAELRAICDLCCCEGEKAKERQRQRQRQRKRLCSSECHNKDE